MSDDGYLSRVRGFWFPSGLNSLWWLLFALPPLHFLQTLVHEGSHGLASFLGTGKISVIAPFPHFSSSPGFDGFLNGITFSGGSGFVAFPQFVDLVLVAGLMLILFLWPVRERFTRFVLRVWYLGVCVDLLYNTSRGLWGGSSPSSDWGKFEVTISTWEIVIVTWLIWLFVWSHFIWVYFSAWHRHRLERAGFWDYQWIAFVFGLLSLAAILFSVLVDHPYIVKDHAFFIVPLLVQVAAFAWYVIYLVLSFRHIPTRAGRR